ncbi:C-X-C chemokine receptor type 3.1 [Gouania willdenowi]|uniref:C-X-C chemokine receptor type 3 n=1 Tax=Gouania willdenowi TaxID=441366 RepID=A0A8C5ECV2_GOUWI|nr:C-X-C chemokine receptor type 3-like [Gouania willdenowi]
MDYYSLDSQMENITNLDDFLSLWELLNEYNSSDEDYYDSGEVCDLNEGMTFKAVFIPILYSLAFVVGILGNGVLLAVLFQSRKTRSVTDTFILHLALADILLLMTLPFWTVQYTRPGGWAFGTPHCKITGSVFTMNFYCGIFLLACISLDRYLSIVHATQMYSRRKSWMVQVSCLLVWLLSLLLSIPDWYFLEALHDERRDRIECVQNYFRHGEQVASALRLTSRLIYHILGFLLPSAVLVFCYSSILHKLSCRTQGVQKQKAFRVIVAVVVVFFISWTPYNIALMVDTLYSNDTIDACAVGLSLDKALTVTASIGYLHCSLNPILYAFVGVKFRRQLIDVLRSLSCKLKSGARLHSSVSRRSSAWSESADTSNSIAI